MKQGDVVEVVAGPLMGEVGRVICAFGGVLTVLRADWRAFDVPATDCRAIPAGGTTNGQDN